MALDPGPRIGPYEIVTLLGAGGMGQVYEAHDARLNRRVALKVLSWKGGPSAESRRRFVQEAQAPALVRTGEAEINNPVWTADGQQLLLVAGSDSSNGGVLRVRVDGAGSTAADRRSGLRDDACALA